MDEIQPVDLDIYVETAKDGTDPVGVVEWLNIPPEVVDELPADIHKIQKVLATKGYVVRELTSKAKAEAGCIIADTEGKLAIVFNRVRTSCYMGFTNTEFDLDERKFREDVIDSIEQAQLLFEP